jgi:WhiB family redox-sensing transcriptional regulator
MSRHEPTLEITGYRDYTVPFDGDADSMPLPTSSLRIDGQPSPAAEDNIVKLWSQLRTPSPPVNGRLPCQQENPALWFSTVPAELNLAKAYCRGCYNRPSCLSGALERAEPTGVWGGEIFEHGRIVAFKRPRGRPRKTKSGPKA